MSKEFIIKWYERVPPAEKHMPFIYYKGKTYTPYDIYKMALEGTLPDELQKKIEKGQFTNIEEKFKIGLERVRTVLKQLEKSNIKIAIGREVFTPKQLLEEVEKGTELGRELVMSEIKKWEIIWQKQR